MGKTGCAQSYFRSDVFAFEISYQRIDSAEFEVSPVDQPDPFGFVFDDGNLPVLHLITEGQETTDPETEAFSAARLRDTRRPGPPPVGGGTRLWYSCYDIFLREGQPMTHGTP